MNWYRHPCSSCVHTFFTFVLFTGSVNSLISNGATVAPTKSGSHVIFCLQLLSKTLTCTLHLS